MDIKDKSVTELKAIAYDCLAHIEAQKQNLQMINARLSELLKVEDMKDKEPLEVEAVEKTVK